MSERRTMRLYNLANTDTPRYVTSLEYTYTTQAVELQIANQLAVAGTDCKGFGYVAIIDNEGNCINKLEV